MGRSAGISRREVLTATALVMGAGLAMGGYSLYRGSSDERARQQAEASRIVASRGEAVEIEGDGMAWSGVLRVTLLRSTVYDSVAKAQQAENLGVLGEFDLRDGAYIVCEVELGGQEVIAGLNGDDILNVSCFQLLYPDGESTTAPGSVWTSGETGGDEMAGMYGIRFGKGDEVAVRLGFSLPEQVKPEGSRLVYFSRQYQFLLGFEG